MTTLVVILIAAAVVLIVALLVLKRSKRKKTEELQGQFGPEYDRTLETADNKRAAEHSSSTTRARRSRPRTT